MDKLIELRQGRRDASRPQTPRIQFTSLSVRKLRKCSTKSHERCLKLTPNRHNLGEWNITELREASKQRDAKTRVPHLTELAVLCTCLHGSSWHDHSRLCIGKQDF